MTQPAPTAPIVTSREAIGNAKAELDQLAEKMERDKAYGRVFVELVYQGGVFVSARAGGDRSYQPTKASTNHAGQGRNCYSPRRNCT